MLARFLVILGLLAVFSGCHNEPSKRFERRYEAFVELLDGETVRLFEGSRFDEASARFDARLAADPALVSRFTALKDQENILFFSTGQVFRFFGETIRQRIAFHRAVEQGQPLPPGYVPDH